MRLMLIQSRLSALKSHWQSRQCCLCLVFVDLLIFNTGLNVDYVDSLISTMHFVDYLWLL